MSKPAKVAAQDAEVAQPVVASPTLVWTTVVGFAVNVVINYLSAAGKLGPTNAEISAKYPTVITPAGYAFSIWGLIFTLQMVAVVIGALNICKENHGHDFVNKLVNATGAYWQLGWYAQIAWQFAFTREHMHLALPCIFTAFAAFLASTLRLYQATAGAKRSCCPAACVAKGSFFAGSAINAAWVSAATCVQASILDLKFHFAPGHADCVGVGLLAAAGILGGYMLIKHKSVAYGATLVWALVAINKHTESACVRKSCAALAGVLAAGALAALMCKAARCAGCKCPCKRREASVEEGAAPTPAELKAKLLP